METDEPAGRCGTACKKLTVCELKNEWTWPVSGSFTFIYILYNWPCSSSQSIVLPSPKESNFADKPLAKEPVSWAGCHQSWQWTNPPCCLFQPRLTTRGYVHLFSIMIVCRMCNSMLFLQTVNQTHMLPCIVYSPRFAWGGRPHRRFISVRERG